MADGDTPKTRIARLFKPNRKRKPTIKVSEKWYTRRRMTVNMKLRQAILDVLPFVTDKDEADKILRAIFDTIVEAVISGQRVVIWNLGAFEPRYVPGRKHGIHNTWVPAHYKLAFTPCAGLRKSMRDEENGDTGTDQGT